MCHNREPQASHLCPTCFAVFGVNFVGRRSHARRWRRRMPFPQSALLTAEAERGSAEKESRTCSQEEQLLRLHAHTCWTGSIPAHSECKSALPPFPRSRVVMARYGAHGPRASLAPSSGGSRGIRTRTRLAWAWTSPIRQDRELLASHLCLRSFPVFGANLLEQTTAAKDPPKLRGKCDTSTVPASTWPCTYARRCTTPARPAAPA